MTLSLYQILMAFAVVAAVLLAAVWLGVCIGAQYVIRQDGSDFLNPYKRAHQYDLAETTGETLGDDD